MAHRLLREMWAKSGRSKNHYRVAQHDDYMDHSELSWGQLGEARDNDNFLPLNVNELPFYRAILANPPDNPDVVKVFLGVLNARSKSMDQNDWLMGLTSQLIHRAYQNDVQLSRTPGIAIIYRTIAEIFEECVTATDYGADQNVTYNDIKRSYNGDHVALQIWMIFRHIDENIRYYLERQAFTLMLTLSRAGNASPDWVRERVKTFHKHVQIPQNVIEIGISGQSI